MDCNSARMSSDMTEETQAILDRMTTEESKAWDSMCRYKFEMFGYHASRWVMLNQLLARPHPNPFRPIVKFARSESGFVKK